MKFSVLNTGNLDADVILDLPAIVIPKQKGDKGDTGDLTVEQQLAVDEAIASRDTVVPLATQVDQDATAVEIARQQVVPLAQQVTQDATAVEVSRQQVVPLAQQVQADRGVVEAARDTVLPLATQTQEFRNEAQVYATTAGTAARFFDTIALGRAAVADGQTFGVRSGGSDALADATTFRRDSATTQTAIVPIASATTIREERISRVAGDEKWPDLIDDIDGLRHVQINVTGQVVAYEDASGVFYRWDADAEEYVSDAILQAAPLVEVERSERIAAVAEVQGNIGAGDERWPELPIDYLGNGARHFRMHGVTGRVSGYEGPDGNLWEWNGVDGYAPPIDVTQPVNLAVGPILDGLVGRVENRSQFDAASSWQSREHAAKLLESRLAELGVQLPLRAPSPPQNGGMIPQLSYDHATYADFDAMCIPSIAIVGRRMWRAEFGRKNVPAGTFAEGAGSYSRLSYCDIDQPGGLMPENWITAAYFHPPLSSYEVKEHLLMETPDGRLAMYFVVRGGWGYQPWGWLLNNAADGEAGSWDFGPPSMIYPGIIADNLGQTFLGRPYWHGDHQRICVFRVRPSDEAIYDPAVHRMIYCRVHYLRDTIELEELATIPAQANGFTTGTWQEISFAPYGRASVVATMRTRIGPHITWSHEGGKDGSWSVPVRIPFPDTNFDSKSEMSRSPTGRLFWVHNAAPGSPGRSNMAIAWSEDGMQTINRWIFDPRGRAGDPNLSYPYTCYGRNPDGTYNGIIYVAHDRGRGHMQDPVTGEWVSEILLHEINEFDLIAGTPTITTHTFFV